MNKKVKRSKGKVAERSRVVRVLYREKLGNPMLSRIKQSIAK